MPFSIDGRDIGKGFRPYFVAEMSGNHNNDIRRAFKIIDAAKESGADAVKIQTYTASTITIDHYSEEFIIQDGLWKGKRLFELYNEASTPWDWHKKLFDHANNIGISIFSSPFDFSAVDFLEELSTPAYKIASPELVDLPLIKKICATSKPIIMSTGASSLKEISEAVSLIKSSGLEKILLLHCTASYPAPISEANLSTIQFLKEKFDVEVGLSDHTLGTIAATTAVSLGASLIEKHFTLSREDGGIDSPFSLEPKEFSKMVKDSINAFKAIGSPQKKSTQSEAIVKKNRRSLYVVKKIKKGEIITEKNIRSIRPSNGIPPKFYLDVLGKKTTQDLSFGDPLKEEMIENFKLNKSSYLLNINNILVTSSSNKNPLIVCLKESLKSINSSSKIFAGDTNQMSLTKYDADEFWHMPPTVEDNIEEIVEFCLKNEIEYIFPTRDGELLFWSRYKEIFKSKNINVIITSKKVLDLCLDKIKFFKFCKENKFYTLNTDSNINKVDSNRFVVKERYGSASDNLGLNLNKKNAIIFSRKLKFPIFQPYLDAKEISIDSWVSRNGSIPAVILRYRSLLINGESKVTKTFQNANYEEQVRELISSLGITGPLNIQAFIKEDKLIFSECNPRIGGASTISVKNGLDIFKWSIFEIIDSNFEPNFYKCPSSVTQLRTQMDRYFYDNNI